MSRLIVTIFVAAILVTPGAARAADITARAKLKDAVAAAKKWQADAALSGVGTTNANRDGTSSHWTYSFQSKKTRSCLRIVALATGATTTTELGTCTLEAAIPEDFVDSPAALSAALSGGFEVGETINFALTHKYDEKLNPSRPCWTVYSPENDFDSNRAIMGGWCVDPKSGKFVTRTVGQGGRNR